MQTRLKCLLAAIAFMFIGALHAQAQTFYYLTLINEDGNPASGCSVEITGGSGPETMSGVNLLLLATVNNGNLSTVQTATCAAGNIDSANIATALTWQNDTIHPLYTLSGAFIEYRLPNAITINANTTVGFASSTHQDFSANNDLLFTSNGDPILLLPLLKGASGVPIPWAPPIILLLIALTLGILGARFLRHPKVHRLGVFALTLCLIGLSGAVYSALRITLDGLGDDWGNAALLATDPAGDATPQEIDLTQIYGALQDNRLYLKLHIAQQPEQPIVPVSEIAEFRLLGADISEPNEQNRITASGDQTRIRGIAKQVRVKNVTTNAQITTMLVDDNWQVTLPAQAGDLLELTPIAPNDQIGGSIYLQVQGTAQEPTLPPDPINDPNVAPVLNPQDIYTVYDSTKFLYTNEPPIQIGVDPETIKPKFSSLIVGKVLKRDNTPLSGVTVKIKDHDEYGYTLTRADGQLDLVVNGGQWFVVEYTKEGYLPVQRKVQVSWQDYGYLPDVVMIPLDNKVSVIDLRESEADFQVHQGSIIEDKDGQRQVAILFPKGTTATMRLPDGSTQNLDVLNVRATEYTIGENGPNAMPGELPPATGYTYAVEYSVDQAVQAGATRVDFDKTLTVYVDNFLEFPVGVIVPSGWYDPEQAAWVPDDNGRIVQVLGIENNLAVLDVTGSGVAATAEELDAEGVTTEERKAIANLYPAGETLWRVGANHFTTYDYNWPYGPEPCEEGEVCEDPDEEPDPDRDPDPDPCKKVAGCEIQVSSRTMSESVPVTGTPFTLNYNTSRSFGFLEKVSFSESYLRGDGNLKKSIISIEAGVQILGRSIATFSDVPENVSEWQIDKFMWDGKDRYGREIHDMTANAKHSVTYNIPAVYYGSHTTEIKRVFAQYSSSTSFAMPKNKNARTYVPVVKTKTRKLYSPNRNEVAPWSLNEVHRYDAVRQELYLGNGMKKNQNSFTHKQLTTLKRGGFSSSRMSDATVLPDGSVRFISGLSIYDWNTETGNVTALNNVNTLDVLAWKLIRYDHRSDNGGVYLVDIHSRIFYRESSGDIAWVAGLPLTSGWNYASEASPDEIRFSNITDIHLGMDNVLYIADAGRSCVQKLDTDNKIRTVAGQCGQRWATTQPFDVPAGTLADQILLYYPVGLAQDATGNLYIADQLRYQIFKIHIDGTIEPYAGIGDPAVASDTENCQMLFLADAPLESCLFPDKLAVSGNALYFIADYKYASTTPVLFKINDEGEKEVVAGDLTSIVSEGSSGVNDTFNTLTQKINKGFLTIGGDDSVYLFNQTYFDILTFKPSPLPGFDGKDVLVPESNGRKAYRFNSAGRHLETIDALTGAAIYQFDYDGSGLLSSITDFDGGKTTITRSSNSAVITSADGHQTRLTYDSNGLLTAVSNPNNETWKFEYDDGGLMLKTTNPGGQSNQYTYDETGRLLTDTWPNGGGWTISGTFNAQTKLRNTILTSKEGRVSQYQNYNSLSSNKSRTSQNPDGSSSESSPNYYGTSAKTIQGDLTISSNAWTAGDPRFGLAASYTSRNQTTHQIGSQYTISTSSRTRFTDLYEDDRLFPVKRWGEESWYNDTRSTQQIYDHEERLWTNISVAGKTSKTWVDDIHRPLKTEMRGLPTTEYTYDQGRVTEIKATNSEGISRVWKSEYDDKGNLAKSIDPLGRKVSYEYDAVGRLTKQTLPDGRSAQQKYDAMGNLIELTTPSGEKHQFNYDTMGDKSAYAPPEIANTTTNYYYNKERQPVKTVLPGGSELGWIYEQSSGRLLKDTYSEGERTIHYDDRLRITEVSEGNNSVHQSYNSFGQAAGQRWEGEINGALGFYYDDMFYVDWLAYSRNRINRIEATGSNDAVLRQKFTYGEDDEITAISLMKLEAYSYNPWQETGRTITFERDPETLRLLKVQGWNSRDQDERTYNAFGELTAYSYHRLKNYGQPLDQAEVTLSDNENPVDFLKVEGTLILEGGFADLNRLWLISEHKDNETPFTGQWFNIELGGVINGRTLGLEGEADIARDITVSVSKEGLEWQKTTGKITRQKRTPSPITTLSAIEIGALPRLYELKHHDEDRSTGAPEHCTVTSVDPATGATGVFTVKTQNADNSTCGELIGAENGGVYIRHRSDAWDCGETDDIANDCIVY
ncbi:MAG: hypothetical protein LBS40_02825, partial [Burkholderiales bacterium]|nr:hypothetical protein [Burkholderiales bacterium]